MLRLLSLTLALLSLAACDTYVTPRYAAYPDTTLQLKAAASEPGISVGPFSGPASFEATCRAAGPLSVVDGMSHTNYIRKALEDELKVAGLFATGQPRVVLSGQVRKLEFSSSRALTGGSWTIELTLTSSNGGQLSTSEYYEFDSGFVATTACMQTAQAFMPAVQNLISKTVRSSSFAALLR